MSNKTSTAHLAVLIDADNASAKIADGLFEEIAKFGEASVRRIYGDFSVARSKAWADILDFTRLASRIREHGLSVYGFGEQKTPESLRQACHRFIFTENLVAGTPANGQDSISTTKELEPPSKATPIIKRVFAQVESEDGWIPLGTVGTQLAKIAPDFDSRTYGFRQLNALVEKTNAFEIDRPKGGTMRIRIKPATTKRGSKK
jgi:hypothetical protein